MDRAEAIKRLTNYAYEYLNDGFDQEYEAVKMAIAALREQEPKWISVKERLPEGANGKSFCELVLAYTVEGEVTTGWINGDAWFLIINDRDDITRHGRAYVTHWMPLPKLSEVLRE